MFVDDTIFHRDDISVAIAYSEINYLPHETLVQRLALAVTSQPDFDDTPLWDENEDDDATNDGGPWHSHWVALVGDETCGEGGLKVRDIPEGETSTVPETWPELPILGVTAGLQVNANLHDPFLCVSGVSNIASGDLSLPGIAVGTPEFSYRGLRIAAAAARIPFGKSHVA